MATRFEIVISGDHAHRLRAAGEEAIAEIRRIEARLSYFRSGSEISRVNLGAADAPVRVSPQTFRLLARAREFYELSGKAFDVTVAPLMHCWGFRGGSQEPSAGAVEDALRLVGMELVELDERTHTVRFQRAGVRLDLGAIGKGHALDEAAQLLREAGVTSALLHGGTSSVQTIGGQPDGEDWRVGIDYPSQECDGEDRLPLSVVTLRDRALSVSGVRGRMASNGSHVYGHVIDPRTGMPAASGLLAAVVEDSATAADALSTALLTLGLHGHEAVTSAQPHLPMLLVAKDEPPGGLTIGHRGLPVFTDQPVEEVQSFAFASADSFGGIRNPR